jgi:hypothetical protein
MEFYQSFLKVILKSGSKNFIAHHDNLVISIKISSKSSTMGKLRPSEYLSHLGVIATKIRQIRPDQARFP